MPFPETGNIEVEIKVKDNFSFRHVEFQTICTNGDILVGNWIWTQERDLGGNTDLGVIGI